MKPLTFLFISILVIACSGTKRISETSQKDIVKQQQNIEMKTKVDAIANNITKPEIKRDTVHIGSITQPKIEIDTATIYKEAFNHDNWDILLQHYVSNHGNVNYKAFKNNRKALLNYITLLSENTPNENWTKADELAYWINAYNAMTIDLILRHYPVKSIKDIEKPWQQRFWKLGEKWYNLDEIEHQILRKMNEPRIHFAIVCASYSCPKLQNRAFVASNIEEQLTMATKTFLSDSSRNIILENQLQLSKIFQWFAKDFKQEGALIDFINQYSKIQVSKNAKKSFLDYNWDLNE